MVLFLGNVSSPLVRIIHSFGDEVRCCNTQLDIPFVNQMQPDFLVSYGYPYILKEEILQLFPSRAINLHISYLPWNRGSDPDLWSLVDDTPKGVTIHYLDRGVDTGDIIVQKEVVCSPKDSLGDYYDQLHLEIRSLFKEYWPIIKSGSAPRQKQEGKGSYHRSVDREKLVHLLKKGSDTLVKYLMVKE